MKIKRIKTADRIHSDHFDLIQFEHNGVILSVGYGTSHYCDSRDASKNETETVEVAVWREGQEMERIGNDSVAGWVPVEKLETMLHLLRTSEQAEKAIAAFLNS